MPFEILESTPALLTSVTNRVEKHGDEDVPAISLGLKITAANTLLDKLSPTLRHTLYKAVEGQDVLPGIEHGKPTPPSEPTPHPTPSAYVQAGAVGRGYAVLPRRFIGERARRQGTHADDGAVHAPGKLGGWTVQPTPETTPHPSGLA